MNQNRIPILIADDDPEDRLLIKEALEESRLVNDLIFVADGEELMERLRTVRPLPGLILLDLNMPKMDGREALKEIKCDPGLKHIPVVVLTTSKTDEDVYRTYDLGVNSFITKPIKFADLVETMRGLGRYWFEIVELPKARDQR